MISAEEVLSVAVRTVQVVRFSSVAAGAIVVLDHLVTLDQEVELIWRSPNGSGKWLFVVNRYYGLITVLFNNYAFFAPSLTDSFCRRWFQWQGWSGIILCAIAELILQLGLFALYRTKKKVLVTVFASFIVTTTLSGTLLGIVLRDISAHAVVLADIPVCTLTRVPKYLYVFWVPMLAFETLLCGLAIFRSFQNMRLRPPLYYSGKRIVDVLFRDSVVHLVVLFTTYVVNMVMFLIEPETLVEIPIIFTVAISCIVNNRLLLNIRQVIHDRNDVMPSSSHTATGKRQLTSTRVESVGMGEIEPRASLRGNL